MNSAAPVSSDNNVPTDFIDSNSDKKALHYLIDKCAKRYSDKTAVKFHDRSLTYKELYESANQLAKLLADNGVQRGDIVAVVLDRSPEMVISLLAILKCGAAYLPLDPQYPQERIEFMIGDSSAKFLLTSEKYGNQFRSDALTLLMEPTFETLHNYDPSDPEIDVNGEDLAYIIYTSGSTGKPKGVLIRHYSLVNFLLSMQRLPGINAEDKLLAISTISFDIAGLELYLPLISGAQIILADAETAKDGWLLLDIIKNENISIMQATPYTWRMLLEAGWDKFLPLKAITGGEALSQDLAAKLLSRCSALWNQYGPTETTVYSTQKLITDAGEITIGKPVGNTQVYILDENRNNRTDGTTGEIVIGGDGVAKGYLNRPDLTAEKFIDDIFSPNAGDKMYRTGDLGRLTPDGDIQCLGRIDQQVKVRGYRIEPGEIEQVLLGLENIKEAVVTVREDAAGEAGLVAYLVLRSEEADLESKKNDIKQALTGKLPAYMTPDEIIFISSIPVTPNGKIDRKALTKPAPKTASRSAGYTPPRTGMEKLITGIWEKILGIKNISVTDDFFSLGGHSLAAIQIMAQIQKATYKRLPIATLLEHPTIEELASTLENDGNSAGWASLVPIKPHGSKTPLYIVHGDGLNVLFLSKLARNMDQEQPIYGLQARGLKGDEQSDVMEEIATGYVNEIIAQNPTGPYLIAGYSFGGYIAVEMRKQMVAMGKEVKMLIIFDTDAEKSKYRNWRYLLPRKIKRHLPRLISLLRTAMRQPVKSFKYGIETLSKNIVSKALSKRKSGSFYREIAKIKDKLRVALDNYKIEPFDDKVHLYRARTCVHYVDDTECLGWKKYAKEGVDLYDVPGDHLSMLLPPNVEEFAHILQKSIDRHLSVSHAS